MLYLTIIVIGKALLAAHGAPAAPHSAMSAQAGIGHAAPRPRPVRIRIPPPEQPSINEALTAFQHKDNSRAEALLRQSLAMCEPGSPTRILCLLTLGDVCLAQGRKWEAFDCFMSGVEDQPNASGTYDVSEQTAFTIFELAKELGRPEAAAKAAATILAQARSFQGAELPELNTSAYSLGEQDGLAYLVMGMSFLGDVADSERVRRLEAAARLLPMDPLAKARLADALHLVGRNEEARELRKEVGRLVKKDPAYSVWLSESERRFGSPATDRIRADLKAKTADLRMTALKELDKAAGEGPEALLAAAGLIADRALAAELKDDVVEATVLYSLLLERDPTRTDLRFRRAEAWLAAGDSQGIEELLILARNAGGLTGSSEADPEYWVCRVALAAHTGDGSGALGAAAEMLAAWPIDPRFGAPKISLPPIKDAPSAFAAAQEALACRFLREGKPALAAAAFKTVLPMQPAPWIKAAAAVAYARCGDLVRARRALMFVRKGDDQALDAWLIREARELGWDAQERTGP